MVALAAGLSVFAIWAREHRQAMAARGITPTIDPHAFGWVCFGLAAVCALLNYWIYARGYMFSTLRGLIDRDERPREFRFWLIFGWLLVVLLLYVGCNALLR
jgi:hypothetical protein